MIHVQFECIYEEKIQQVERSLQLLLSQTAHQKVQRTNTGGSAPL